MRYPKPSDIGGTLIRRVLATVKAQKRSYPFKGPIAIAVSGGVDSMVLAHLLCRYGRKLIPDPATQVTLLHFDHQWRPESATREREAVAALAQSLGVQFESIQLPAPAQNRVNENREDDARQKRQGVFDRWTQGPEPKAKWILTAHHEDDVLETLIWRFFRGEMRSNQKGILFKHGKMLRPFLQVTKEEIRLYAQEESVPHFEDPTNHDSQHLRAWLRVELIPVLVRHFPGYRRSLMRYVKS